MDQLVGQATVSSGNSAWWLYLRLAELRLQDSYTMSSVLDYVYRNSKELIGNLYQLVPPASKATPLPLPAPKMDVTLLTAKIGASPWIKVAALSGAIAVMMGAYGAHGLKLTPEKRTIFETANKYHFYHTISLLAVPFLKRPNFIGALFLSGILIFSGTCYCNAITGNTTVVRFTPIGGFMFILGWISMLF